MEFWIKITDQLKSIDGHVEVIQKKENGVSLGNYRMSLNDLLQAINDSTSEEINHETPFLPSNCIKLISKNNGYDVFIELKARIWQIEYKDQPISVGFPRMILKYSVSDHKITELQMVAIKKGTINNETEIYCFPYSNVHHLSGVVCMGMNKFPKIDCLTQLENMHFLFFGTPFGNDYGAMTIEGKSLEDLFSKFTNKKFDNELLMPTKKTFGEFFNIKQNHEAGDINVN